MIEKYRKELDSIDKNLADLLEERFAISREIGIYKQENGMEVYDPRREEEIRTKLGQILKETSNRESVLRIFDVILEESKSVQK